RRPRPPHRRRPARVPLVRRRLLRPGVRAGDGHPGDRRPQHVGGARVRPGAARRAAHRVRRRRGGAGLRLARAADRAARRDHRLGGDLAPRPCPRGRRRGVSVRLYYADDVLEELEKRVRFNGFYPYRCDRAEYDRLSTDREYRDRVFTDLMVAEVARWIALAEERLAGTGIRCYVMPGNDDEFAIDGALQSTTVVNPDNRVV